MNDQSNVPTIIEKADRSAMPSGMAPRAIVPQSFEQAYRFAELITRSGMAPKGFERVESCMVAILHGLEVGLTPMAALQSIAVVNGRPTIWGDGAMGLVRGSGLCEWIEESLAGEGDAATATCRAKRRGDPKPAIGTFSMADAKKAGLVGKQGPWTQYPKRMLQMRARAFALRDGFADVLRGVSIREEVEDYVDVTPQRETPPRPPRPDAPAKLTPPRPDAQPQAVSETPKPEESDMDWRSQVEAYDNALSACESAEDLNDAVSTMGSVFVDAPEVIRAEATKLEADNRARVEGADTPAESPRETLISELRSRMLDGEKLIPMLNGLGDRRELLTEDDVRGLKAAEKAMQAKDSPHAAA